MTRVSPPRRHYGPKDLPVFFADLVAKCTPGREAGSPHQHPEGRVRPGPTQLHMLVGEQPGRQASVPFTRRQVISAGLYNFPNPMLMELGENKGGSSCQGLPHKKASGSPSSSGVCALPISQTRGQPGATVRLLRDPSLQRLVWDGARARRGTGQSTPLSPMFPCRPWSSPERP